MKTRHWIGTTLLSFVLISLTGCSMTDPKNSTEIPSSGVRSVADADADTKRISSDILGMIRAKGKASDVGPGVSTCGEGKDIEKYFRMRHPWGFTPDDPKQLPGVMKHLKEELSATGWKVVEYAPDTSPNKNLNLTADNDKKGFGVNIVHYAKDNPPKLGITVVSGCYQVPKGQKVEHY